MFSTTNRNGSPRKGLFLYLMVRVRGRTDKGSKNSSGMNFDSRRLARSAQRGG
jgi:hypothetical protein